MVPTRTGKTGEHSPVREKSGNFAKTRQVREFYPKYRKIRGKKLNWNIEKNTGKVREICQPVMKTLQIWYHTLNKKRTVKNTGKGREICHSEKVGIMV